MKRQGRPAAPWTPTTTFFSEKLPSPSAETFLAFLAECGCLTNSGERLLSAQRAESLRLRDEHIRTWARALVEQAWPARQDDWPALWQTYRQSYDFCKPVKPNRLQRWLVRYSRDATALGLLANLDHFPGLADEIETMAGPASGPEAELLMDFVRARRQPQELLEQAPDRLLLLLAYLGLGPEQRLELAWLAARGRTPEPALVSRACNLTPVPLMAVNSLTQEARESLAETAHRALQEPTDHHLGACALRTVGDARSLPALRAGQRNQGQIRFGSRPGRDLFATVCRQAESAILARARG
ncbi:MAG: hypothetical protein KC910_12605 [Candidatus Eremiobacteraeota bacterium]|nr:hypothetical protein [Candidatus Eremiobacteraeota bacterium]